MGGEGGVESFSSEWDYATSVQYTVYIESSLSDEIKPKWHISRNYPTEQERYKALAKTWIMRKFEFNLEKLKPSRAENSRENVCQLNQANKAVALH